MVFVYVSEENTRALADSYGKSRGGGNNATVAARGHKLGYTLIVPPSGKINPDLVKAIERLNVQAGSPDGSGILTFDQVSGQIGQWTLSDIP
jgi:hypothetical protein